MGTALDTNADLHLDVSHLLVHDSHMGLLEPEHMKGVWAVYCEAHPDFLQAVLAVCLTPPEHSRGTNIYESFHAQLRKHHSLTRRKDLDKITMWLDINTRSWNYTILEFPITPAALDTGGSKLCHVQRLWLVRQSNILQCMEAQFLNWTPL